MDGFVVFLRNIVEFKSEMLRYYIDQAALKWLIGDKFEVIMEISSRTTH